MVGQRSSQLILHSTAFPCCALIMCRCRRRQGQ
jgi:hypothetical protein